MADNGFGERQRSAYFSSFASFPVRRSYAASRRGGGSVPVRRLHFFKAGFVGRVGRLRRMSRTLAGRLSASEPERGKIPR